MPSQFAKPTFALAIGIFSLVQLPCSAQISGHAANQAPTSNLVADATTHAPVPNQSVQLTRATTATPPSVRDGKTAKGAKAKKEKQLRAMRVNIERGTLTVDGLACKAALNYEIDDLRYLYMYVPGSGTIVVARQEFPGSEEQKGAFHDHALTVSAGGHVAELYSSQVLLSRKPSSAWVRIDTTSKLSSRYPVLGYGATSDAPYSWPVAIQLGRETGVAVDAPPLPRSMLQTVGAEVIPIRLSTTRAAAPTKTASASAPTVY